MHVTWLAYLAIGICGVPCCSGLRCCREETRNTKSGILGLDVTWTKTKIQDFRDLPGESVQLVYAYDEGNEVTERFTSLVVHD